jgi:3',5'-cyclic AMP phosphodiesterase CpdA
MKPVLLAQLSDVHIGANWEGVDPQPRLEAVIEAVRELPNPVDAVVVSGDLADDASEQSYELVRQLLGRFEVPVHVLPGNHDNRARLRQFFELPGTAKTRSTTTPTSASSASSSSTPTSRARTLAPSIPSSSAGSTRS